MTNKDVDADFRPELARRISRVLRPLIRLWFRYELTGVESLPDRPCIIAGNHSGIGIADAICLLGSRDRFPASRRIVAMMHDLFVSAPLVGAICRASGAVRAHPDAARQALGRGYDVVVFPGGGLDSCRPFTEADRVVFGHHRGYVRLALETGAPIVPLATTGSHHSYLLLPWIGDAIGQRLRRLGLSRDERLPIPVASVLLVAALVLVLLGGLPWWTLALAALVAIVPNPVSVRSKLLPVIDVTAATKQIEDPKERIEAANALVLGVLSHAVANPDRLICSRAATRRRPIDRQSTLNLST
jgi:diacylglycerol/phytol O-acyltransferase